MAKSPKDIKVPSVRTEHTQRCYNEKRVDPDVRKEIVRTMSVMLTAVFKEPEALAVQYECVANSIVIKYPFLADPYGPSQLVSFFLHYKLFHLCAKVNTSI